MYSPWKRLSSTMSSDQFWRPLCFESTSESLVHGLCGGTNGLGFTGNGVQTSICAGSCPCAAGCRPDTASTRHAPTAIATDRLSFIGEPPGLRNESVGRIFRERRADGQGRKSLNRGIVIDVRSILNHQPGGLAVAFGAGLAVPMHSFS